MKRLEAGVGVECRSGPNGKHLKTVEQNPSCYTLNAEMISESFEAECLVHGTIVTILCAKMETE